MGRRSFLINVVCILPWRFVEASLWVFFKVVFFKICDSTLMARWTNFFIEEYSYNSTTSRISRLKPLTNIVIFDSSLLGILILVKVVSKSSKYSFTVLGPWWSRWSFNKEQTARAYMLSNHTNRPWLATCLAQCPLQFVATIGWWWIFMASAPRLSEVIIVPKDEYRSHKEQWIIKYNNR